uniref:(northern house mosquito) hypothetical protein n=1 Tax=Culex pipiens TaxID=7175 RepID=A0A8D8ID15_CULPI
MEPSFFPSIPGFPTISIAGSRNGCDDEGDAGQGFHNTHTGRQGWARSARKVNEEGFFFIAKKKFGEGFGRRPRAHFFVFEVDEVCARGLKRERRNFMNKESCKLVEAKLQTIYYTHTYTRGRERARARENL